MMLSCNFKRKSTPIDPEHLLCVSEELLRQRSLAKPHWKKSTSHAFTIVLN